VGLGVFGQSLIILTQGQPWAATGVDPASMALAIIQPLEPCTSRNSIVNTPQGVLYSSPNGLINVTPAGAVNLTITRMLKQDWDQLLNLGTIAASIIMLGYYAYSLEQQGVFQVDAFQHFIAGGGFYDPPPPPPPRPVDHPTGDTPEAFQPESHFGTRPGAYVSLTDPRIGVAVLDPVPHEVQNVITDIFNGETMIMRDGVICVLDIRQDEPYAKYLWRSKIWSLPYIQNLAAAKIYWTPPADPAFATTFFRVYAGEVADLKASGLPLRYENKLGTSGKVFRLPSGYKALYYQFEVEGYALVNSIHVAQSARDLRQV
jgi:hypothetical protein